MKKVSTKALMVITLMVASFTAAPIMVAGYDYDDDYTYDQIGIGDPTALVGGFGSILGSMFRGLGSGGNVLATVFEMLFMQTLTNFSQSEIMPGVYVISAFSEENHNGIRNFGSGEYEYYMPPYGYNQSIVDDANQGYAYCEVKKEGTAEFNLTIGAGVTLLIYDQDESLIFAINKIINFINRMMTTDFGSMNEEELEVLIRDGVEVLTWFLIHINDIFTGEELFALNPITWQNMKITPLPGFALTKTWRVTGNDYQVDGPGDIEIAAAGIVDSDAMLIDWNNTAKLRKDNYMEWLLRPTDDASLVETRFTSFTFDLLQLWVKNFEIHIDAAAIINLIGGLGSSGPLNIADIFRGLDIEFYLFTHHLGGAFLYNDTNADGKVSSSYKNVTVNGNPVTIDGVPVEVPDGSEITHRIMLGTVGDFIFEKPYKTGADKISWGLKLNNPTIIPVPVGVDLESYLGATEENLGYIHFGFSFQPKEVAPGILSAPIKLDQFFAPWNDPTAYHSNNDIHDLDLAIIYLSTMLHFHLEVATIGEDPEDPTTILDPADDYNDETHTLKVGNYLGQAFRDELAFVDIAGPEYEWGVENEPSRNTANASSAIIPLALYEGEVERHDTFQDESGEQFQTFATDISLNVSLNVMAYAVCFPAFEGGSGIWHDPTFSVFMVFEATGFWALILLIAGVGLVGIATILIKRRKDMRF